MSIPPPERSCQKALFASVVEAQSPFLFKMPFPWPAPCARVKQRCRVSPWPAGWSHPFCCRDTQNGPTGRAGFPRAPLLQSSGFGTTEPVWSWGWMTVASIQVKSFWCVAEKGLSRTAQKGVDICADIRSEVSEAGLRFCLGSLPPTFNVTEN